MLWEQDVAGSNPVTPTISAWSATTLYALVFGAGLGLAGLGTFAALLALSAALAAKLLVETRWDTIPLLGWRSGYTVYCYNLERRGETTHHAWISYAVQLFLFGLAVGGLAYMAARQIG